MTNGGDNSGLSLTEIQKLEEEREREAKMRREIQEAALAKARKEEEARRQQVSSLKYNFELSCNLRASLQHLERNLFMNVSNGHAF